MGIAIAFHWENRDLLLAYVSEALGGFGEGNPAFTSPIGVLIIAGPQIVRAERKLTDMWYNSTNFRDTEMSDQRGQVT